MKQGMFARLELPVLKRHISEGKTGEADSCAIALAIQDAVGCDRVTVDNDLIVVTADGKDTTFKTPKYAAKFIARFDNTSDPDDIQRDNYDTPEQYRAAVKKAKQARAKLKPFKLVAETSVNC